MIDEREREFIEMKRNDSIWAYLDDIDIRLDQIQTMTLKDCIVLIDRQNFENKHSRVQNSKKRKIEASLMG